MKRLIVPSGLLAAFLIPISAHAAAISTTNIRAMSIYTPAEIVVSGFAETSSKPLAQAILTGASAFRVLNPASAAITIGGALAMYMMTDKGGNKSQVLTGKDVKYATPANWVDSETPPKNPETGVQICEFAIAINGVGYSAIGNTPQQACSDQGGTYTTGGVYGYGTCAKIAGEPSFNSAIICSAVSPTTTTRCSPGYVHNGTPGPAGCVIPPGPKYDYPKWPSDGITTIKPKTDNSGFEPHPRDPDTATQPTTRTGTDEYGNPVSESVSPNASGGVDYQRNTQSIDPNTGLPNVQKENITTDNTGQVKSHNVNTYPNSTLSNVQYPTNTAGGSSQQIDTSSLAQEATLQQTNNKLDQLHEDLTTPDPDPMPALSTPRTFQESTQALQDAFSSHFALPSFTDTSVDCPTYSSSIPFINVTLTIDQHCLLDDSIRPTITAAMTALWLLLGLFIILRA